MDSMILETMSNLHDSMIHTQALPLLPLLTDPLGLSPRMALSLKNCTVNPRQEEHFCSCRRMWVFCNSNTPRRKAAARLPLSTAAESMFKTLVHPPFGTRVRTLFAGSVSSSQLQRNLGCCSSLNSNFSAPNTSRRDLIYKMTQLSF